jgi:hypothetical protein
VELGERDRAVLDVERDWWLEGGTKEESIRRRLGLSPSRYYRLLHALLDVREAMAYDPLVVRRLHRVRRTRRQAAVEGRRASIPPQR